MKKLTILCAIMCMSGFISKAEAQTTPQFVGEMSVLKQKVAIAESRIATLTCNLDKARSEARRGIAGAQARIAQIKAEIERIKADLEAEKAAYNFLEKTALGQYSLIRDMLRPGACVPMPTDVAVIAALKDAKVDFNGPAFCNNGGKAAGGTSTDMKGCRLTMATSRTGTYSSWDCSPDPSELVVTAIPAEKPKRLTHGECALYALTGLAGAGVAQIGPAVANNYGQDVSGRDYGLAAGIGAGAGYLLAFGICELAR